MSDIWEESDQLHHPATVGKIKRNLHWWVAFGLSAGVLLGFLGQGLLFKKVQAESAIDSIQTDPMVLGQAPAPEQLTHEFALQKKTEQTTETPTKAEAVPVQDSRLKEAEDLANSEEQKRQALIASSPILAINRTTPASDLPPNFGTPPPPSSAPVERNGLGPADQTTNSSDPSQWSNSFTNRMPVGISPIPAGLSPPAPETAANGATAPNNNPMDGAPIQGTPPALGHQILEGTLIPAVLLTQINSDLPGLISAQVSEDVYDSIQGDFLAIPKGSRVIGEYRSHLVMGQERVMAVFHRLILPSGESFKLDQAAAADETGQSGMKDQIDNRFWTRFGGQFMTAGLAMVMAPNANGNITVLGGMGNSLATSAAGQILVNTAAMGFMQNAMVGPVIIIRKGYPFVITVNHDMKFNELEGE